MNFLETCGVTKREEEQTKEEESVWSQNTLQRSLRGEEEKRRQGKYHLKSRNDSRFSFLLCLNKL